MGRLRNNRGFALTLVVWAIGLFSLLMLGFVTTARLRLQAGANIAAATQAEAAAQAALNVALLNVLNEGEGSGSASRFSAAPVFCAFADALTAIVVEDESGKVDINASSKELLERLLLGRGLDGTKAQKITKAIIDFRSAPQNGLQEEERIYRAAGRPFAPKKALFTSILELDQIPAMTPDVLARLRPLVTVHSFAAEANMEVASEALREALNGNRTMPGALAPAQKQPASPAQTFTIHVEAAIGSRGYFAQEAIVSRATSSAKPWKILEWRQGDIRYRNILFGAENKNWPKC